MMFTCNKSKPLKTNSKTNKTLTLHTIKTNNNSNKNNNNLSSHNNHRSLIGNKYWFKDLSQQFENQIRQQLYKIRQQILLQYQHKQNYIHNHSQMQCQNTQSIQCQTNHNNFDQTFKRPNSTSIQDLYEQVLAMKRFSTTNDQQYLQFQTKIRKIVKLQKPQQFTYLKDKF